MRDKLFQNFKQEAENFFVKELKQSKTMIQTYVDCIETIYGLSETHDCNKGIIAYSPNYGQGKSFFFQVVNHRHRRRKGVNAFFMTSAKELSKIYTECPANENPVQRLEEFINVKNLFIDDIGDEGKDKTFSHYGNKLNVVRHVLLRRYELWTEKGYKTYGTTNLSKKELEMCYEGRVIDRLDEMIYIKEFKFLKEGSFRQMEGTRRLTQIEIKDNWKKFQSPVKVTNVDMIKYWNELINETDDFINKQPITFWKWVIPYMIEHKVIKEDDFDKIGNDVLIEAERVINSEVLQTAKMRGKYGEMLKAVTMREEKKKSKHIDVYEVAKAVLMKRRFNELRELKHVFK